MASQHDQSVSELLRANSSDILERWEAQIRRNHPVSRDRTSAVLRDLIPEWLEELAKALDNTIEAGDVQCPMPPSMARQHGRIRAGERIPVDIVIQEFLILREVVLDYLQPQVRLTDPQMTMLIYCIDRATVETSQAYVKESDRVQRRYLELAREKDERFRIALQAGSIAVYEQDRDLVYTAIHPEYSGYAADMLGKTESEIVGPEQAEEIDRFKRRVMETGESSQTEVCLRTDAKPRYYRFSVEPQRDARGNIVGTITASVDITELRATQKSLEAQQESTEHILKVANVGLWTWNPTTDEVYLSPHAKAQLGYADDEIEDSPLAWRALIVESDRVRVKQLLDDVINSRRNSYSAEFRAYHRDGSYRWLLSRGSWWSTDHNGIGQRLVGVNIDISDRKAVEKALLKEKRRAQVTLDSISEGVITTDENGVVQQLNPAAEATIGWSEQRATGQDCQLVLQLLDDRDGHRLESPIMECLRLNQTVSRKFHTRIVTGNGSTHPIAFSAAPIHDPDGSVIGAVLVYFDVSEERRLLREMAHQASHDELTGLANRREFESRLSRTLEQAQDSGFEAALLFLDLDRFKVINDTCGHSAGDRLLRELTRILLEPIRDRDILARIGGDEFGVILEHCSSENARDIALQLRERVSSFRFACEGRVFELGVSIGIASIDSSIADLETVVARADAACYLAKTKGRNRVEIYQPESVDEERNHHMHWLPVLQQALATDAFRLFCQPFEPVTTKQPRYQRLYFEILLRFENQDGEIVPAESFIAAAERHDLMPEVDLWVIQNTFQWLNANPAIVEKLGLCNINISAAMLADEMAHEQLLKLLEYPGFEPQKICFEITEAGAIANKNAALTLIETLRKLGYRFALDDFGTGLASFAYLKQLPVDFIKIDGSFVERIARDPYDLAVVRSVNDLSHSMGKQTIAECVNGTAVKRHLANIGVDFMQGFDLARPKDLASLKKD